MASRRILLASGRYGPELIAPGYIAPVYIAVARKQITPHLKRGTVIGGVWSYDLADARVRVSDWVANNEVPPGHVKIVKAYVVGYGGAQWGTSWNAGLRRRR